MLYDEDGNESPDPFQRDLGPGWNKFALISVVVIAVGVIAALIYGIATGQSV